VNEVMKFGSTGTGLMNRDDLTKSLNNMATAAPRVGGEYQFLKLDKGNGDWIYGQEETLVEKDALWAVNPGSLEYGFISWDQNQKVEGEVMVSIQRPLPDKGSIRTNSADGLPTGQNGWQYQQSVVLVCINGEDEGTVCQYKQSSVGSQKLFKTLVDAIFVQAQKGDAIVPIVKLKSDNYKHDKYGRIYNPIMEIVEWRTMDDTSPVADEDQGVPETKEPERQPRKRAAPAASAQEPETSNEDVEAEYAEAEKAEAEATPRRRVRR